MNHDEAILRALAGGADTVPALMSATGRSRDTIKHRLRPLVGAGLVSSSGCRQHALARYRLLVKVDEALRALRPRRPNATALLSAWPMPVAFPPVPTGARIRREERA